MQKRIFTVTLTTTTNYDDELDAVTFTVTNDIELMANVITFIRSIGTLRDKDVITIIQAPWEH